ncbi:MAG: 50S ribosomal protein L4 [Planctomycetota bacterium]|jgi:large subunit ribosomal protein L4
MIDVPVYDMKGEQTGTVQIDEAILGGSVRIDLLKQAVLMWRANQRQGSARTKCRSMKEGSSRKLFRQKGTGNARMGTARNPIRRGGGVAFAKLERDFRQAMPKKMRRLARNSALLAKLKSNQVAIIEPLSMTEPKTKAFYAMVKAVGADKGCVVALDSPNEMLYKSARNVPNTEIRLVHELSAYEILRRRKLIFTHKAFDAILADPVSYGAAKASVA